MEKTFIVFGVPDYESECAVRHVQKLIQEGRDIQYGFAAMHGKRVFKGRQAYSATEIIDNEGKPVFFVETETLILFECGRAIADRIIAENIIICDHHLPGHPGFTKCYDEYQEGSSLGQLLTHFNVVPSELDLMIMACDHCLPFAYNEQCPGINPVRCKEFRLVMMADYYATNDRTQYKSQIRELRKIIGKAQQEILSCPSITITRKPAKQFGNYGRIYDIRNSEYIDELNEAVCRLGAAYIEDEVKLYDPNTRIISLKGLCFPWMVEQFKKYFQSRVSNIVAVPNRGFAKAYVSLDCNPSLEEIFA